jgi:ATP-dependent Clp protease ATP-binding subunit ClpB
VYSVAGKVHRPASRAQRNFANRAQGIGGGATDPDFKAANELLERAFKEAANFKDICSTEHLLRLALTSGAAQEFWRGMAPPDAILKALTSVRGSQKVTDQNPEARYQALERYARDLTEQARRGKLDPVIGRDEEDSPRDRCSPPR